MELCVDVYSIPSHDDLIGCSRKIPLDWNPVRNFKIYHTQSPGSFEEHKMDVRRTFYAIDQYLDYTCQCNFVTYRATTGSPGSGKSCILNYIYLYAMSKGLKVAMTSLMAQQAVHLGGIHLHKLFYLPVKRNMHIHQISETSLHSLVEESNDKFKMFVI